MNIEKSNTIEQIVTRQEVWEIQICDNAIGSYSTYLSFGSEDEALRRYQGIKFRLIQKAIIEVGGDANV
jgi:hypothetical protein